MTEPCDKRLTNETVKVNDMSETLPRIRFRFAARKAYAAIRWMVAEKPSIDLHTLLKACYFADKDHLNRHERPIFGATYRAMPFGPVPIEIYDMVKCEPLSLADMGMDRFPWKLDGFRLVQDSNANVELGDLSSSDIEALRRGLEQSSSMTLNQRTAATHGRDWQAARLGIMDYEDMIDDGPQKAALVEHLRREGRFLRL
jgi:uncharacterized phage-associated protein